MITRLQTPLYRHGHNYVSGQKSRAQYSRGTGLGTNLVEADEEIAGVESAVCVHDDKRVAVYSVHDGQDSGLDGSDYSVEDGICDPRS